MNADCRKANRLHLAFKDMENTLRYLQAYGWLEGKKGIEESKRADCLEAILKAAIVSYSCPFKHSKSGGRADKQVNPQEIGLFDEHEEYEEIHKKLLEIRDKGVAHGDWEYHETELIEANPQSALRRSSRPSFGQEIKIPEFEKLVKYSLRVFRDKAFDLDRNAHVENNSA